MNVTEQDVAIVLQDWYDWVMEGANDKNPFNFSRCTGLCAAVAGHPRFTGMSFLNTERDQSDVLTSMIRADGLRGDYPFDIDADAYDDAYYACTHHLNTRRIAWVLKTITPFGGG